MSNVRSRQLTDKYIVHLATCGMNMYLSGSLLSLISIIVRFLLERAVVGIAILLECTGEQRLPLR